ncbi:ParB/RepB/Spo0J family partition protein [Evtepia gabavorous]|uniref:ParB/RepB/Spo0J family partition protein n=1 Tax=Evtepia gabavorous TaxID=2211183 RepID=UPI003A9286CC
MADDKLKTGLEEQQVPESPGPAEPGGSPTPEQPAPEHPGPEAPQEENTPAAPSGKVIDLTEARAAGEKTAEGPAVEEGSPKHRDEAFRDLFGNEEKPPWEKSLDEIKEEENAQKRRGRPKKAKDKVEPNKPEKGPGTRKGRPAKADKAALDKSPAPGVLDKVSRGGKKDKDKETGSGGIGPGVKAPKGKAAPVKEAEAPPPEIKLPPMPEVPPRPVEEGKIVYLKMAELHPFHTFREHPYKVQDDKAMDDLVGTIKEHGIMTPATVRPEKDGKGYEIIAGHRRHHGGTRAGLEEMPCIVREMTDLEAVREMRNSNKQRGEPLPSERAKRLDLELEAMKRQGARPKNENAAEALGKLSVEIVGKEHDMNYKKVLRYVRLNHLVPELLEKVDAKNMGFMPAVELSYIKPENQRLIAVSIDGEQSSPSVKQAKRLRELDQEGLLNGDVIDGILSEEKREVDNVIISTDELNKYFGKEVTPAKMKEQIMALLDEWKEKQPPELAKPEKKNELDK